jgi:VanZ family protein
MEARTSPLARYLLAAYVLLLCYASLHPLTGWRDTGIDPLTFLGAPLWPRYYTVFDLTANVLVYMPLGALGIWAIYPRLRGPVAFFLVVLGGTLLSLLLETLQGYLPNRIPSELDWVLNTCGVAPGAAFGLSFVKVIVGQGILHDLRHRLFRPGKGTDAGLVLLAAWLLTQLDPATLLFGNGDLRKYFEAAPELLYPAVTFVRVEALVSAAQMVVIALLVSLLVNEGGPKRRVFLLILLVACVVRSVAFATFFEDDAFIWLTPGALFGLTFGAAAALGALSIARPGRVALCGVLLMAATTLVNIAPDNPYLAHDLQVWRQGQFLNFNGFTHLVSVLWPFAALAYLLAGADRRRAAGTESR